MTDERDQHDGLDEIFRKSLEMLRQPLPAPMREASPFEGMLNSPLPDQHPKQQNRGPDLLHGLVDDATLKAWLIHEIQLLSDLISDDDRSIFRAQETLQSCVFRRDRLAKLRQAFEILRDDIVAVEGS